MEMDVTKLSWTSTWKEIALRGVVAFLFGLALFIFPRISLGTFLMFFAAFAFIDGILLVLSAVTGKTGDQKWWVRLIQGLLAIGTAIVVLLWPGMTLLVFIFILAGYFIAEGILQIIASIQLRKVIRHELLHIAGGVLSIILGALLIISPMIGAIALTQTIGIFAIAFAIMELALAFTLWRESKHPSAVAV